VHDLLLGASTPPDRSDGFVGIDTGVNLRRAPSIETVARAGPTIVNHGLPGSRPEEAPACDEADEAIGATGVVRRDELKIERGRARSVEDVDNRERRRSLRGREGTASVQRRGTESPGWRFLRAASL